MSFELNQRHQQILSATVRQYISTAEPVGSKTLVDGYNLNISPATIRNGFATLEKAGFLYQPHTSAGRVPSDLGYRFYVDRSIEPSSDFGRQVERLLTAKIDLGGWSLEAILRGAVEILAEIGGYITMITLPQTRRSTIEHLHLLRVESTKIMSIVVWDTYETQSLLMQLPVDRQQRIDEDLLDRELQILSNFLNSQLRGRSVLEVSNLDWSKLDRQFQQYVDIINNLLAALSRQSRSHHTAQITICGISEFLAQPEFSQVQQVQTLLHLLEAEQGKVCDLIFNPQADIPLAGDDIGQLERRSKPTIRIGIENPLKPMQSCTLISANYHQGSTPIGSIGILGPKRMLYENAIALVQSAADYLSLAIGNN